MPLQLAGPGVRLHRREHVHARVRALVVVDAHCRGHGQPGRSEVRVHRLQELLLEYAVHPLGQRILQRVAALRHGDGDVPPLQQPDIPLAAVLDTPIGMMDQITLQGAVCERHFQSPHASPGGKVLAEKESDDLAAVGIGNKAQVGKALLQVQVGNPAASP